MLKSPSEQISFEVLIATLIKAGFIFSIFFVTELDRIADIKKELSRLRGNFESQRKKCGGTFEWVNSLLVRALQAGDWLLIDNVNFCR